MVKAMTGFVDNWGTMTAYWTRRDRYICICCNLPYNSCGHQAYCVVMKHLHCKNPLCPVQAERIMEMQRAPAKAAPTKTAQYSLGERFIVLD